MATPAKPSGLRRLFSDKWFALATVAVVLFLYCFSYKPAAAVKACHEKAQESAKSSMQRRVKMDPRNAEYQAAMQAGMFVDQDYVTFYRNCMRAKGKEPR